MQEEILVKQLPPVPRLKWSLLEPGVEFSSSRKLATSGWAGRQEDIDPWRENLGRGFL